MGSEKLWDYMQKHMEWGDLKHARDACLDVMKECHVCQACQRPLRLRSTMDFSPVPPVPMSSVAIDLFRLPLVVHEGKNFDTMAVCVCRHSGWLIAVPCLDKGLTGAKVAQMMLDHWRPFGLPSFITSDRGAHFVGAWWKTMCSRLGIFHNYTPPTTTMPMVGRKWLDSKLWKFCVESTRKSQFLGWLPCPGCWIEYMT